MRPLLLLLLLASCATPAPEQQGKRVELWATKYYVQLAKMNPAGIPLRNKAGEPISPPISVRDFCACGVEGTCHIEGETYNWMSRGTKSWTSCSFYSPKWGPSAEKSLWAKSKFKYGIGNKNNPLTPFLSIAADQSIYPFGTWIYIPAAKGVKLPDGSIHDGKFRVDDVGGAIKGNHIDVFVGKDMGFNFPFVKSTASGTFEAWVLP